VIAAALRRYFLRMYAKEMQRSPDARAHWGAFGEATYQTVLLAILPIGGIFGTMIVIAPSSVADVLEAWRGPILIIVPVFALAAVYVMVRRLVADYRRAPPYNISDMATRRDTVISNIQFCGVLLCSIAMPFVAWLVKRVIA
jgi:hypothetical protein